MKKMINWTKKEVLVMICAVTCVLFVGILATRTAEEMDRMNNVTRFYIENECDCEWDRFEIVEVNDGKITCNVYQNGEHIRSCVFDEEFYGNMMDREDS